MSASGAALDGAPAWSGDWPRRFEALPRAALEDGALIVTDLHLPPLAGPRTVAFEAWCASLAADPPPRVVCLGDLFDVWVGRRQLALSGTAPVAAAIRGLVEAGVPFDLLPGNRDSLLDESFAGVCGAALRRDGLVLEDPAGARLLCLHGDELCVRETGYLRLRAVLRSAPVRALSRVAPLFFARWVGRRLRQSFAGARRPPGPRRGPQQDAALAAARAAGAAALVTGHTHRPEDRLIGADDTSSAGAPGPVRWITLGAFGEASDLGRVAGGAVAVGRSQVVAP